MDLAIGNFVIMYLLLPLMAVVFAVVCYFVAKKNGLLSNKKLIFMFLLFCLILALPGFFGFIQYWFMPYVYIGLQVLYFFLGWLFASILKQAKDDLAYYAEFLIILIVAFVGAALFSLIFNLTNELQYGLWAATCLLPFIFPSVFRKAYESFLAIPIEVHTVWAYDKQSAVRSDNEMIDGSKVIVVEMELKKQWSDKAPQNIKAKAQEDMLFGEWFKMFIDSYNVKNKDSTPIAAMDKDNSYGWSFYTLNLLGGKRYIDPNLSFTQNKIKEHKVIIAKRAQRNAGTDELQRIID